MSTKIKDIIKQHETETYPNGVGSIFRCIESNRYQSLEEKIKEVIIDNIMNDLYCDIKDVHPKDDVIQWVKGM